jgi:hypothetical protein
MRTWVKVTIAGVAVVVLGLAALAGMGAYFVLRHVDTRSANAVEAQREFDAVHAKFGARPPLIEVVDLAKADIRINRLTHPDGRRASTMHVLTWNADDDELFRTDAPVWLMRFSTLNVASQLGIAPEKFRLTVEDVQRYGPGIVIDFSRPGKIHALLWVD